MFRAKITIVDDSVTFREGLRFYVEKILNHEVISEASDGLELINGISQINPDVILMDIEMPGLNGIETMRRLIEIGTYSVIAVTNYDEFVYLNELVFAGFRGYIIKKNIHQELETAINKILGGDVYFPENISIIK